MKPQRGNGRIQWSAGGWLGSQLGGTAWMAVSGGLLIVRSLPVGASWLVSCLIVNLIGCFLYSKRRTLAPYPALQSLLAAIALGAYAAWTALVLLRPDLLPLMQATALQGYVALLIIPGLMIWFHIQESIPLEIRRVTPRNEDNQDGS